MLKVYSYESKLTALQKKTNWFTKGNQLVYEIPVKINPRQMTCPGFFNV